MELTFEQLPKAVSELHEKLSNIEQILLSQHTHHLPPEDQLLTIKQAAELLCLAVPTIYGMVSRSEIPVCKKGKRLYFSKKELNEWVKTGRKKMLSEIEMSADAFLRTKRK